MQTPSRGGCPQPQTRSHSPASPFGSAARAGTRPMSSPSSDGYEAGEMGGRLPGALCFEDEAATATPNPTRAPTSTSTPARAPGSHSLLGSDDSGILPLSHGRRSSSFSSIGAPGKDDTLSMNDADLLLLGSSSSTAPPRASPTTAHEPDDDYTRSCVGTTLFESLVVAPWWKLHITDDERATRRAFDKKKSARSFVPDDSDDSDEDSSALLPDSSVKAEQGAMVRPLARVALCVACICPWASFRWLDVSAPLRSFILWMLLMNAGFTYVSVIVCRRGFFRGRHGGFRDFCIVNVVAPLLYYLGPYRYSSALFDQGPVPYLCLIVPYLAILHLTYLVHLFPHCGRSLSIRELESCGVASLIAYFLKFAIIAALGSMHVFYLLANHTLWQYLPAYLFTALVLTWCTAAVRYRYYLHLHHWFMGCLLTPLCHVSSPLLSLASIGICAAQFVEGASKWSCAPLWHQRVRPPTQLSSVSGNSVPK